MERRRCEHRVVVLRGQVDLLEAADVEAHESDVSEASPRKLDHVLSGLDRVDPQAVCEQLLGQLPGAGPDLDDG